MLTLFADDFHAKWEVASLSDLEHALDTLALLFSTLKRHGMTVNAGKSKAILAISGTQAEHIRGKFVAKSDLRYSSTEGKLFSCFEQ